MSKYKYINLISYNFFTTRVCINYWELNFSTGQVGMMKGEMIP